MYILNASDIPSLESYLQARGWLSSDERVSHVSVPGAGNMNYVLRITTPERSFIIKQSRGYVEKYPQVSAPADRVLTEAAFYQMTKDDPLIAKCTPELIGVDHTNHIMALEDLGLASDFTFLYHPSKSLDLSQLTQLSDFLSSLHRNFHSISPGEVFRNDAMRSLNYEHIFLYPFMEENGLDLDVIQPGLRAVAAGYKKDDALKENVGLLGQTYLAGGNCLLHGDFYPGSWLETAQGVKIIDPEFCFYGPAEFDLGVMIAHLHLAGQSPALIGFTRDRYSSVIPIDNTLLDQFVGIEIIRRLIGLAQLPLQRSIQEKQELLSFARALMMAE